jgi:chromate transporter
MAESTDPAPPGPTYTLTQLVLYALKLGTIGFGGPVALVGYMHRDLVEARKWISEQDYKEGLTLAAMPDRRGAADDHRATSIRQPRRHACGSRVRRSVLSHGRGDRRSLSSTGSRDAGGVLWVGRVIGTTAISAQAHDQTVGKDKLLWAIFAVSAAVTIPTNWRVPLPARRAGLPSPGAAEETDRRGSPTAAVAGCWCPRPSPRLRRQRWTGRCWR